MIPSGLGDKIRSAYLWTGALQIVKNVLGFGLSLLLARFLEPRDYGLVGMVTVLIGILSVFQDWGMGQAVIYFKDEQKCLPTYFTISTATGILFTLILCLAAPGIGAFYGDQRLVPIVRLLSVTLLLGSVRSVSQGLLTKRFQFRSLTLIETGCTLGAAAIAVVLAWNGFGAFSLVVNILLGGLLQTALFCWVVRPRFTLRIDWSVLKRVLRWGLPLTGGSLLWQFYENSDYLVIGKVLGASALGQYTMAFRLATVTNDKLSSVINRVSFPSFSAMQDDLNRVTQHWFSLTRKIGLLTFPLLVVLAVNAQDFVAAVLGSKWLAVAPMVKFLCVMSALKSLSSVTVNLACARGCTDIGFRFCLVNALLLPISFVIGCKLDSAMGVAVAWCLIFPVLCIYLLFQVTRLVGVKFLAYFRNLMSSLLGSGICFVAMLPLTWLLPGGIVRLFLRSGAGMTAFVFYLASQPSLRDSVREVLGLKRAQRVSETIVVVTSQG
jgi:O-antigen/teichoic acid export membrane protein